MGITTLQELLDYINNKHLKNIELGFHGFLEIPDGVNRIKLNKASAQKLYEILPSYIEKLRE